MRALSLAVASLVALAATPVQASPSAELGKARDAFRADDCPTAMPGLGFLLYPTPRLAQTTDLIEAHVLLGACLWSTQDLAGATREFEEALALAPTLTLDPLLFSPGAIQFFERTRRDVDVRIAADAAARKRAEELERLRAYKASLHVYEVRPYFINFVPFGAGQFQNGQRGKGIFFAATQFATAATSAGIWSYLVGKYGFGGRVPPEDASTVFRLQQIEIGAGAAFIGLAVWGIIDSHLHYKPRAEITGDDSLLPVDLRDVDEAPGPSPAPAPGVQFRLLPTPLPDGGAIMLDVTF